MPKAVACAVSLLLVLATAQPGMAATPIPSRFQATGRADLYTGVGYLKLEKPGTPVVAHVAHVVPGAPVDLRVVNAFDNIPAGSRELETTSSMCRRVRCVVGVDGDFHYRGAPVGGVVSGGRMIRSPNPAHPQVTVTGNGRLVAGPLEWSGSLNLGDGSRIPLAGINVPSVTDGLVLYTPAYGGRTPASANVEMVVSEAAPLGTLNRSTPLELKGVRSEAGPIPPKGGVLSAQGAAAQELLSLWGRVAGGTLPAQAELAVQSPVDAAESIGANPVVLRDGRRALPWTDPNLVNPRQPHTLVGWNTVGDVYLVAVDGRQTASEGMTMAEAADFLLGLGVTDAVNLDGGGGTVLTAGGSVWNRPSDNSPTGPEQFEERGAVNAFVVTARAGAALPRTSPPRPTSVDPVRPTPSDAGSGRPDTGGAPLPGTPAFATTPSIGDTPDEVVYGPAEPGVAPDPGAPSSFSPAGNIGSRGTATTGADIGASETVAAPGAVGGPEQPSSPVITTPFRVVSSAARDIAAMVVGTEVADVGQPGARIRLALALLALAAVPILRRRRRTWKALTTGDTP